MYNIKGVYMDLVIHTDGSKSNSGSITWGFVVMCRMGDGSLNAFYDKVVSADRGTCNTAEYLGVDEALEWIIDNCNEGDDIKLCTDSLLAVNQVNEVWEVRSSGLKGINIHVKGLRDYCIERGINVCVEHISRDVNMAHDVISAKPLDYDEYVDSLAETYGQGCCNPSLRNEWEPM
jgi:ribonuclease HI